MKLYIFFLLLSSISAVWAQSCQTNSCFRQVNLPSSSPAAARSTRRRDCTSFLRATVTPVPLTVSRTRTVTAARRTIVSTRTATATRTVATRTSTRMSTATVRTTSTARTTITTTTTITVTAAANAKRTNSPHPEREALFKRLVEGISHDSRDIHLEGHEAHPLAKRQNAATPVTARPTARPTYASSCANSSRYASACSCLGVSRTTTTVARPTYTTTIVRTVTPSTTRTTTRTATSSRTASTTVLRTTTTTVRASTTIRTTVTATATVLVDPPAPRCQAADGNEAIEGSQSCKCCYQAQPIQNLLARRPWMEFEVFDLDMCVQLCDNYRGRCKGVEYYGNEGDDMMTCRLHQAMDGPDFGGGEGWDIMTRVSINEGSCETCEAWQPPVTSTTSSSSTVSSSSATISTPDTSTPTPGTPETCQANDNSNGLQGSGSCGCCYDVQSVHKLMLHYDDHRWVQSIEECIQAAEDSNGFYKAFEYFETPSQFRDIACRLHRVGGKVTQLVTFEVKSGTIGKDTCKTCEAVPKPWDANEECNNSGSAAAIIKGFYDPGCHCCWQISSGVQMLARTPDELMSVFEVTGSAYRCIQECDKRDWCIWSEGVSNDGGWQFECRMFASTDGPMSQTGDPKTVVVRASIPDRSTCENCPVSGPPPGQSSSSLVSVPTTPGPVDTPLPTPVQTSTYTPVPTPGQCQPDGVNQLKGDKACQCCYKVEDVTWMLSNPEEQMMMKAGDLDKCAQAVDASNGRFKAFEFFPYEGDDYACALHEYKNKQKYNAWSNMKFGSMIEGSCPNCEGGPEPECRKTYPDWDGSIKGQSSCGCCWDVRSWNRLLLTYDEQVSVNSLEECIQQADTSQGYYKSFQFFSPPDAPNTSLCRLYRALEGDSVAYDVSFPTTLGRIGAGSCTSCASAPSPPWIGEGCQSRWGQIFPGKSTCECCWNTDSSNVILDRTPELVISVPDPMQCTQECDSRSWCFQWELTSNDNGKNWKCRMHQKFTSANLVLPDEQGLIIVRGWVDEELNECTNCAVRPPFTGETISTSTSSSSTSSAPSTPETPVTPEFPSSTSTETEEASTPTSVPDTCEPRDGFESIKIIPQSDQECGCCWDLKPVSGWLANPRWSGGDSMGKEYCARDCERDGARCAGYEVWGENLDDPNSYTECRTYQSMDFATGPGYNWGGSIMRAVRRPGTCGKCEPSSTSSSTSTTTTTSSATATFTPGTRDPNNNQCYNPGPSEIITGWAGCDCCWDTQLMTKEFARQPDFPIFNGAPDRWWCIHHCDSYMGECKAVESFSNDDGNTWGCRLFREDGGIQNTITNSQRKVYRATIIDGSCLHCDPDAVGTTPTPRPNEEEPATTSTPSSPSLPTTAPEQCPPLACFNVETIYRVWGNSDPDQFVSSYADCAKKCIDKSSCIAFDSYTQDDWGVYYCNLFSTTTGPEMDFGDSRLVNYRGIYTPEMCDPVCQVDRSTTG